MKELDNNLKELLKNINKYCIEIVKRDNLDCKLKKLDFLEQQNFYKDYSKDLFQDE